MTMAFIYNYDPSLLVHFYTNASTFTDRLVITQFRSYEKNKSGLEVFIVYNSFTFLSA